MADRIAKALGYRNAEDLKKGWGNSKVDIYKSGNQVFIRAKGDRGEGEWIGELPSTFGAQQSDVGKTAGGDDICACGARMGTGTDRIGGGHDFFGGGGAFSDTIF